MRDEGKHDLCFATASHILNYSQAADVHKGLCHWTLAHSDSQFLDHADEAGLYASSSGFLSVFRVKIHGLLAVQHTQTTRDFILKWLKLAPRAKTSAREDHDKIELGFLEQCAEYTKRHGKEHL